jgi:hypothetical protein
LYSKEKQNKVEEKDEDFRPEVQIQIDSYNELSLKRKRSSSVTEMMMGNHLNPSYKPTARK